MRCGMCGNISIVIPVMDEGKYKCKKCRSKSPEEIVVNEYTVRWRLRDTLSDMEWVEEMDGMTLSDFEVAYGNITHHVVWVTLRQKDRAII